jgi:hypothetical protein
LSTTPDSQRGKPTVSETVEKFSFGSGHQYLDNADLASKGLRFDVLEIKFDPGQGYQNQDRWLVTIKFPGGEPGLLSLGSNPGRDRQLRDAQAFLARGDKITNVRLRQHGKAYYFTESDR